MGKRIKKVTSFTVDGKDYDLVAGMFKKSGTEVSVSMFVNNCLKELAAFLVEVEKMIRESKEYTVPMSFIIKSIVEGDDLLGFYRDWPEELPDKKEFMLNDWQEDYEAMQEKIPADFYKYIKSGLYLLSPNKKYLIEKKTGRKYITLGKNRLVPLESQH